MSFIIAQDNLGASVGAIWTFGLEQLGGFCGENLVENSMDARTQRPARQLVAFLQPRVLVQVSANRHSRVEILTDSLSD